MAFESKYYAQAQAQTEETRRRNERLYEQRVRETDEKYPDVSALRKALAATVGRVLRLVSDGKSDIVPELEAIERENLSLQEELKSALKKHGLPQDYLETVYTCKSCRDTGVCDGKRCSCFMERVKKAAANDLNSSTQLRLCSFDDFDLSFYNDETAVGPKGLTARKIMSHNLSFCKSYARDFHIPGKSILMRGGTGLGKTHLSLSIASVVLEKGYSVIYGSAPELFKKMEKEYFGQSEGDVTGSLMNADLLVLDDVGAEYEKAFYTSAFYNLLNNRLNSSRPTIVSTNLDLAEINERYTDRITSRLMTMETLEFKGSDVRILKRGRKA